MTRRIVVDENILAGEACFGQFGDVVMLPGREMTAAQVRHADALIVRSVTPVNADLLTGSKVRFVGSTTIGTDHIDAGWLDLAGIGWASAPGCNAHAVVDYCLSVLCSAGDKLDALLAGDGCVGIVGYGNVGSRLHRRLESLGIACIAYDPFLDAGQCPIQAGLSDVLASEVVSLHTPLTSGGPYPTRHMLGVDELARLRPGALLINAGRGEVLATDALMQLAERRPDVRLALDVWEGEPSIDRRLLDLCAVGTPHIAGYSADGKIRGLLMVAEAYSRFLGKEMRDFPLPPALREPLQIHVEPGLAGAGLIRRVVRQCYDVRDDDAALREAARASADIGTGFDRLRRQYRLRRELTGARAVDAGLTADQSAVLKRLGVSV